MHLDIKCVCSLRAHPPPRYQAAPPPLYLWRSLSHFASAPSRSRVLVADPSPLTTPSSYPLPDAIHFPIFKSTYLFVCGQPGAVATQPTDMPRISAYLFATHSFDHDGTSSTTVCFPQQTGSTHLSRPICCALSTRSRRWLIERVASFAAVCGQTLRRIPSAPKDFRQFTSTAIEWYPQS